MALSNGKPYQYTVKKFERKPKIETKVRDIRPSNIKLLFS